MDTILVFTGIPYEQIRFIGYEIQALLFYVSICVIVCTVKYVKKDN